IIKSWRRSYIKGERKRRKPTVEKRFVRIKETLYSYREGVIKVSIKPYEEYLEFDISKAWFLNRVDGELGELILGEKYLTITFRSRGKLKEERDKIAWDSNEKSLDGFNPRVGWVRIDLTRLFHIHRVYELKRKRLQSLASKKPKLKEVLKKYSRRERDRARDLIHKLTTHLAETFKGWIHGFERLEKKKKRMLKKSRRHNRGVAKSDWRRIYKFKSYKSKTTILNLYNSSKKCPKCGMVSALKGALYECSCGLRIGRQLNAAINLYLKMEGVPHQWWDNHILPSLVGGYSLTGAEQKAPDELVRELYDAVRAKLYYAYDRYADAYLPMPTYSETHKIY
ncbi:MAG: zinc ribbon domain-containing protein, partial [Candidatus Methanomethylicaceae archaeon]